MLESRLQTAELWPILSTGPLSVPDRVRSSPWSLSAGFLDDIDISRATVAFYFYPVEEISSVKCLVC